MEAILVDVIVLAAALFLARGLYRNLISHNRKPACDSCDACASTGNTEPDKTPTASSSS
ncbi:MAG: hypothetical protein IIB38_13765 [Candidatus Hydrogenedentes bacterium]|nr:hypothetical protein [Candidatus Hydrogenedentota bacterium]